MNSSDQTLVVCIARAASLAIWHRGRSHRRPNRNESPKRRHFASLDLKRHADFSHRRPTSAGFCFLAFSCDFRSSEWFSHRWQKKTNFFASLTIWGCAVRNRIAHRGCCIARDAKKLRTPRPKSTTPKSEGMPEEEMQRFLRSGAKTYILRGTPPTYAIKIRAVTDN